MTNALLAPWTTPFEMPPYAEISDEDFAPALEAALKEARANVAAIAENPEPPTFENTIEALELADAALGRVLGVFYSLAGADSNPAREALQREFAPKLAAYSSDVTLNAALFARIEALWQGREALGLDEEQARVLMLTRRGFLRAGAQLEGAARDRLREIMARLSVLGTQFTQNLLADERAWFMELGDEDLEGLPGFLIAAARAAGAEKGAEGPVVTLSRSLIVPFLQFSPRRELREKAFGAWAARGAGGGETDNRAITAEILKLREERAHLLGNADQLGGHGLIIQPRHAQNTWLNAELALGGHQRLHASVLAAGGHGADQVGGGRGRVDTLGHAHSNDDGFGLVGNGVQRLGQRAGSTRFADRFHHVGDQLGLVLGEVVSVGIFSGGNQPDHGRRYGPDRAGALVDLDDADAVMVFGCHWLSPAVCVALDSVCSLARGERRRWGCRVGCYMVASSRMVVINPFQAIRI